MIDLDESGIWVTSTSSGGNNLHIIGDTATGILSTHIEPSEFFSRMEDEFDRRLRRIETEYEGRLRRMEDKTQHFLSSLCSIEWLLRDLVSYVKERGLDDSFIDDFEDRLNILLGTASSSNS